MTLNGAIMQLVELNEHPMMPVIFRPAIQKVIETISELEENPEPHWIPCSERLPKKSGCYLVSVKNDHERRYSKTSWFGKDGWFARQDVIAWMPLPAPYQPKKEMTE